MKKLKERARKNIAFLVCVILLFCSVGYAGERVSATEDVASGTDATSVDEETTEAIEEENTIQEVYEKTYTGEGYETTFKIDNKWTGGYTATVTIKNTGETTIENWCVSFPLKQEISNLWNGTIEKSYEDFYVVKNAGWNQDIPVGGSVSFGITVYEAFTEFPEYYTMIGKEIKLSDEDYTVDYVVTEDWGDGYKAEITITNNKSVALEDWRLTFSYGDNVITQIWNGEILGFDDGIYKIGCPYYNQNIPAGGSVTFGFMVEPGTSENIMENISLVEKETDISDGKAIIMGYMEEENNLTLSMLSSIKVSRYEVYGSYDGVEYIKLGETEENLYQYVLTEEFERMEIYAIGYDEAGLLMETNHIYVEMSEDGYVVILPDTDGDGLSDCYEIYYGSDVELIDTDGDKLNDYYEVYVSYTYPTLADSDENGIWDGDEDYDEDGLTILEECNIGTDPINNDTDEDYLLDGEEVNVYGTDPLVADKDEDGLIDGDEIALGTDPYDEDSDDDGVLDGDEKFEQTYMYQVENGECAINQVTITLNGTGNLNTSTTIESVMNKDVLCTGVVGLIGEPFEIETESEFDEATITFKLDTDKLGETAFEDLIFLWYDEENQIFVELETSHNVEEDTVSVVTSHFSKYMIVDKNVWRDAWAEEISYEAEDGIDTYYTVLTIDCSGSMNSNDPIIYNNNISSLYDATYNRITCNRIKGALDFVNCMTENDRVAVVLFDDYAFYTLDFTDDKEAIKLALQKVCNDDGTNYSNAINKSISLFSQDVIDSSNICTRIVFLSDGEGRCDSKYITMADNKDIIIHGIGLGNGVDDEYLQEMTEGTKGSYYQADTSEMLSVLYEKIYLYDQFDKTDKDKDGLYDIFETAGIRLINGQVIYTDPADDDSDDDGLLDGEEIIPEVKKLDVDSAFLEDFVGNNWYYLPMESDPNSVDSEGDGILDAEDNRPMEKGIYSEERGEVVVGELTIVSSTYNSKLLGHSFLIYQSYVDDVLDFTGIEGGYVLTDNYTNYYRVEACTYTVHKDEYITLGNTGKYMEEGFFCITEIVDVDSAGIFFNREIAVEIDNIGAKEQYYNNNMAYSIDVTEEQMDIVLDIHNEMNEYELLNNNCTRVAKSAWNGAVYGCYSGLEIFAEVHSKYNTPNGLKKLISSWDGSYEIDLRELLGL